MDKLCLDCGSPIRGRADKKFCDDQCRNNYNNRQKAEDHAYVKEINRILAKNRNILKQIAPEGKAKIKKSQLAGKGFNFDFYTHHYITGKGTTYIFCYEYGYLLLDNDEILIVKREA